MAQYLFLYGTLLPGCAPGEIAGAVETLRLVGEGSVRGGLYDLGDYPGALIDPRSESRIFGKIFELPENVEVLHELDRYEGFNPQAVADSLFVRVEKPVEMTDGRSLLCWVYQYNLDPVGARVIADGRYQKRSKS